MNKVILQEKINEYFSKSEMKEKLCFPLGISWEDIPGETRGEKSLELVEYCDRRKRLDDLLGLCRKERPPGSWNEVAQLDQQMSPQIREDKLTFLCWVYIKSRGNQLQTVGPSDIGNLMGLEQERTMGIGGFLNQKSLIDFTNWFVGIRIAHLGIVKAEHDITEAVIMLDNFPPNIINDIKDLQQKRSDFLRSLYMKSKEISFGEVRFKEVADEISLESPQLNSVLSYLDNEGWLKRTVSQVVQITIEGREKIEDEMSNYQLK